jgi:hypothetical protein
LSSYPILLVLPYDSESEIRALAKLPEDEQRQLADRAKAGEDVKARPDTLLKPTKRSIEKMASDHAQMLADMTGGLVTTVIEYTSEPGSEKVRIEVTRRRVYILTEPANRHG